jgi:hypothetical protein
VVFDAVIYDAVSDGKHIIIGMLLTGLSFLLVVAIGEFTRWAGHRRAERRRRARSSY